MEWGKGAQRTALYIGIVDSIVTFVLKLYAYHISTFFYLVGYYDEWNVGMA